MIAEKTLTSVSQMIDVTFIKEMHVQVYVYDCMLILRLTKFMEISIFTNQTQQCIERLHILWTSVMYFSHTLEVSIPKSMKSISLQQAVRENANDYMN